MGMGTWKRKILDKAGKGRSESGRSKGIVVSPLYRTLCRRNRSYKHRMYDV